MHNLFPGHIINLLVWIQHFIHETRTSYFVLINEHSQLEKNFIEPRNFAGIVCFDKDLLYWFDEKYFQHFQRGWKATCVGGCCRVLEMVRNNCVMWGVTMINSNDTIIIITAPSSWHWTGVWPPPATNISVKNISLDQVNICCQSVSSLCKGSRFSLFLSSKHEAFNPGNLKISTELQCFTSVIWSNGPHSDSASLSDLETQIFQTILFSASFTHGVPSSFHF